MRYLILAEKDLRTYRQAQQILADRRVKIALADDRQRLFSIEDPSHEVLNDLEEIGAQVYEDIAYSPEAG